MHIIIVGASGMLSDLAVGYAAEGHTVSAIARDVERLQLLSARASGLAGCINPVSVDYRNLDAFAASLAEAEAFAGLADIGVSWIRRTETESHLIFARALAAQNDCCRYVEVRGSAIFMPEGTIFPWRPIVEKLPLKFGIAVLGFVRIGDHSRWLRDDEVCQGVRAAIESNLPLSVIGTLEPFGKIVAP